MSGTLNELFLVPSLLLVSYNFLMVRQGLEGPWRLLKDLTESWIADGYFLIIE